MASNVTARKATFSGFGLVRNRHGQPQFDDWEKIPVELTKVLSDADWDYIKQKRKEHVNNP